MMGGEKSPGGLYDEPARPEVVSHSPAPRPWVTYGLIALTVLVFLAQVQSRNSLGEDVVTLWLFKLPAVYIVAWGEWWRLWTPVLVHNDPLHLGFNMYALYLYGPPLERLLGPRWFLALYLTGALWGHALSAVLSDYASLGASSAVFGLFAAFTIFVMRHPLLAEREKSQTLGSMLGLMAINLLFGLLNPRVDNWGHLGGIVGGAFFAWTAGPDWALHLVSSGRPLPEVGESVLLVLTEGRGTKKRLFALVGLWVLPVLAVYLAATRGMTFF